MSKNFDSGFMPRLAEAVSGLSVEELQHKTLLGHVILGFQRRIQPVRYQIMRTHPGEVQSWVRGTGNPKTLPLPWPALYKNVTELRVHPEAFDPLHVGAHRNDFAGVGYQFDEQTILAAVISTQNAHLFFGRTESVFMRVGHDDVNLAVGALNPWARTFTVPEGAASLGIETTMRSVDPTKPIY